MGSKTFRQIAFGGLGLWMLWATGQSYAQIGLTVNTAFQAGLSVLMFVLALSGKGG